MDGRTSMLALARSYRDAGISVIPIRVDGSKAPAVPAWKPFQSRLATDVELQSWFQRPAGIALVCGRVSGGLEVIDFDDGSVFPAWRKATNAITAALPVVETPSGGFHVFYRSGKVSGNHKIAVDRRKQKATLIETRGEGGYVVAAGSPAGVHPAGKAYFQIAGPELPNVPMISVEARVLLWKAAREFDKDGQRPRDKPARPLQLGVRQLGSRFATPSTLWARFERCASWGVLLARAGWHSRDGVHWTRPGKNEGTSATLREAGNGDWVLVVFSTNAGVTAKTHGKFSFFAEAFYGGDFRAAARQIASEGHRWKK